jgi:hypothetical protein
LAGGKSKSSLGISGLIRLSLEWETTVAVLDREFFHYRIAAGPGEVRFSRSD